MVCSHYLAVPPRSRCLPLPPPLPLSSILLAPFRSSFFRISLFLCRDPPPPFSSFSHVLRSLAFRKMGPLQPMVGSDRIVVSSRAVCASVIAQDTSTTSISGQVPNAFWTRRSVLSSIVTASPSWAHPPPHRATRVVASAIPWAPFFSEAKCGIL